MTLKPLDLNVIRRNWERSAATLQVRSPDRLGHVEAPRDVYVAGAELLERVRRELDDTFPAQRASLAPFFNRVETSFVQLRTRAEARADTAELAALRAQFMAALADLEDISEAFLGSAR